MKWHWGITLLTSTWLVGYLIYLIRYLAVYNLKFNLDFLTYSGKVFLYAKTTSNGSYIYIYIYTVTVFLADSIFFNLLFYFLFSLEHIGFTIKSVLKRYTLSTLIYSMENSKLKKYRGILWGIPYEKYQRRSCPQLPAPGDEKKMSQQTSSHV